MLDAVLQVWGGAFYLLNKIFFSMMERSKQNGWRLKWKVLAWVVYIIGLPAWVVIFVIERNWIIAMLEIGGLPSMILGLIIAKRGKGKEPVWLNNVAVIAIVIGLGISLYDFGSIHTTNQWLEIGTALGFLIGTYQLAKENPKGYLWFGLMIVSNGILMSIQNYPWLMWQQIASLLFIGDAYLCWRKKRLGAP